MLDSQLQREYTKSLFGFYGRAQILGFPFAILIFFLLYGKVDLIALSIWLIIILSMHGLQMLHAKRFFEAQLRSDQDYQRWNRHAIIAFSLQSIAWAAVMMFTTSELKFEFFLLSFFLIVSVLSFSASGYSKMLLVYAIPIFLACAIAGYLHFHEYRYLAPVAILGIVVFYLISQMFEKTLLESIKIRYENQALLQALNVKKDEAEQANRAKSVFLAAASHDLRQPLHAIGLYLDSLNDILENENQRALGSKIEQSVTSLTKLFDSILEVSKLDSGVIKPAVESIPIEPLITQVVRIHEPAAREKGLTISCQTEPVYVLTDTILLERILNNLVSNAIRYTSQGQICLRSHVHQNQITIEVSDTGIGIPQEELNNIFSEFYQLHNPERDQVKGLGLGLFIVRRLCGLLELDLSVESEPGHGTTFKLQLPAGAAHPAENASTTPATAFDFVGLRVLVVDDERAIRDAIKTVLHRWGCETNTAGNIDDALNILKSGFTPSLLVSDYRLKDSMTGFDVIEAVNQTLAKAVPTILITGDTSPDVIAQASSAGHELLHKPVTPGVLKTAMAYQLTRQFDT